MSARSLASGTLLCGVGALGLAVLEGYLLSALTPGPEALARLGWALLLALVVRSALLGLAAFLGVTALLTAARPGIRSGQGVGAGARRR